MENEYNVSITEHTCIFCLWSHVPQVGALTGKKVKLVVLSGKSFQVAFFGLSLLGWCCRSCWSICWFFILWLFWENKLRVGFHWSCGGQVGYLAMVHHRFVWLQIAHCGVSGFLGHVVC